MGIPLNWLLQPGAALPDSAGAQLNGLLRTNRGLDHILHGQLSLAKTRLANEEQRCRWPFCLQACEALGSDTAVVVTGLYRRSGVPKASRELSGILRCSPMLQSLRRVRDW